MLGKPTNRNCEMGATYSEMISIHLIECDAD